MDTHSIAPLAGRTAAPQSSPHAHAESTATPADASKGVKSVEAPPATPHAEDRTRDARSLQYRVDGETHQVIVTVVDERDQTVVRQIPDAEVIRIAKNIDRMQGFLLEGKA